MLEIIAILFLFWAVCGVTTIALMRAVGEVPPLGYALASGPLGLLIAAVIVADEINQRWRKKK